MDQFYKEKRFNNFLKFFGVLVLPRQLEKKAEGNIAIFLKIQ
jgi:hypothetical protein